MNLLDMTSDGMGFCISLFLLKTFLTPAVKRVSQIGPHGPQSGGSRWSHAAKPELNTCGSTVLRKTMGSGDWKCKYIPVMTS